MPFTWVRDGDLRVEAASSAPPGAAMPPAQKQQLETLLGKAFTYLETNAPAHPGLEAAIREMHSAVAAYQAGRSEDPFGPLRKVIQTIEAQRRLDPSIPLP